MSYSTWDFNTTLKGCWQFYITLNIFLWYTVYIYFNLLVRHYFCMFMYDLSWKNVESFIGCLQFFVMDSLKICAILQLTSWQRSFKLTGYLYIIHMYTYTKYKPKIQCNCICFLLNIVLCKMTWIIWLIVANLHVYIRVHYTLYVFICCNV